MDKDKLVIYHAHCDDGFGAALAAWMKLGDSADYHPANYGEDPPLVLGKEVWIVDFSYPRKVLLEMAFAAKKITILDHHKTAREDLIGIETAARLQGSDIKCTFDMRHSGAMLSWKHFNPDLPPPVLLQHVEDNDLWRFEDIHTKAFIRNLRSFPQTFQEWGTLIVMLREEANYNRFVIEGMAQERFFKAQCRETVARCKLPCELAGEVGLMANANRTFASDAGHMLAQESGTYGLTWFRAKDEKVYCSLRSTNEYDVSALAKQFGGGGHKNAAGFELDTIQALQLFTYGRLPTETDNETL